VAAVRGKITMKADAAVGREAATARVVFKDGKTLQAAVKDCRGSANRPLTDEDITAKTRGQLRIVFPEKAAERILAEAWKIETYPLVAPFCRLLGATA
jgi:2-methylcitrate dehydratase PrpD